METTHTSFDAESRLIQYSSLTSCGYNGDGLRAWKGDGQGNSRTYYLYDGDDPVCEFNASGTVTAASDFGPDGVWARHVAGDGWFYTFDPQGCLSQALNAGGSVRVSAIFDAQGGQSLSGPMPPDPYGGFGGQWGCRTDWQADYPSSLVLCGHRFYDFNSDRFINRDPLGYDGGVNLYAYCRNNPVNDMDPEGMAGVMAPPRPILPPTSAPGGGLGPALGSVCRFLGSAGGSAAMGAGMLLGLAKPAGSADEDECVEAPNILKSELTYLRGRPHYFPGGGPLDPGHAIQVRQRCDQLKKYYNIVSDCIDRGGFADSSEAKKVAGKARSVFNRLCTPRLGEDPIPLPPHPGS